VTRQIAVNLPALEPRHDVLATLWARARVDDLMAADFAGIQRGTVADTVREAITQLGLQYRLMTQFTSFVAVEEMTMTTGGEPRRVEVPVDMPEGVSYEGVFGAERSMDALARASGVMYMSSAAQVSGAAGGRGGGGGALAPPASAIEVRAGAMKIESEQARTVLSKIDPSLKGKTGKLEVRIMLSDDSPAVMDQLKKLGFEIVLRPQTAKIVIGRIAAEKLPELEKLTAVLYVGPVDAASR
jgi:Ca-activated chloride channel family protein